MASGATDRKQLLWKGLTSLRDDRNSGRDPDCCAGQSGRGQVWIWGLRK